MQLMCDAVSVLGAKHGVLFDPVQKTCGIIRTDKYGELPGLEIRAGIIVQGREIVLPLAREGENFTFHDQRMTPCTMGLMGIHAASMAKLKITVTTPFRPRDDGFSTIPVLHICLEAEQLPGGFRWDTREADLDEFEFFIEFKGPGIRTEESGADAIDLFFESHEWKKAPELEKEFGIFSRFHKIPAPQRDRLVVLKGEKKGLRVTANAGKNAGGKNTIEIAWCCHNPGGMLIHGKRHPYRYTRRFPDLGSVADWARKNPDAIKDNAAKVDGIIAKNNFSRGVNRMLAYTLHSWLMNTMWMDRDGREFFTVWEGNCYYQSTVDVEYTQLPFYLTLWPELLKHELDTWTEFSRAGGETLGEKGRGTLFLSHDIGSLTETGGQDYPHDMEVEETTNYIIMTYLYWRRTGDDSMIKKHIELISKYAAFIRNCDTTGNGVPDMGISNTVDDASPALQFGREQVYLAVKTIAAYEAAAEIFRHLGKPKAAVPLRALAEKIRKVIERKGWMGDHYAVLLDKTGQGVVHPWTREVHNFEEIPGWDSTHLFTANAVAMMDMAGMDLKLDPERLEKDIRTVAEENSAEYGCRHTAHRPKIKNWIINGQEFNAYDSSWVSSNVVRDIAAFYRGIDLRFMADRYWEWQTTVNTRERKMYLDCFGGNNVCFYPRGVVIWGYFDALGGIVIDKVKGINRAKPPFAQVRVPKLETADWKKGTCEVIGARKRKIIPRKKRRR